MSETVRAKAWFIPGRDQWGLLALVGRSVAAPSREVSELAAATGLVEATVHRLPDRLTMRAGRRYHDPHPRRRAHLRLPPPAVGGRRLGDTGRVQPRHGAGPPSRDRARRRETLAPLTGLLLGWFSVRAAIAGLLATVLTGAVIGLLLLTTRRIHLRQAFAHGPVSCSQRETAASSKNEGLRIRVMPPVR